MILDDLKQAEEFRETHKNENIIFPPGSLLKIKSLCYVTPMPVLNLIHRFDIEDVNELIDESFLFDENEHFYQTIFFNLNNNLVFLPRGRKEESMKINKVLFGQKIIYIPTYMLQLAK